MELRRALTLDNKDAPRPQFIGNSPLNIPLTKDANRASVPANRSCLLPLAIKSSDSYKAKFAHIFQCAIKLVFVIFLHFSGQNFNIY